MFNTSSNFEMAGVLSGKDVRRRKIPQEKIAIIQQTMEPGMTVSHVARLHGIQPSLLFKWKKQYQEGSLSASAYTVPDKPVKNKLIPHDNFCFPIFQKMTFS